MEVGQSAVETQAPTKGRLLRILGIGFAMAASIGSIIGVGILRSPGLVASKLGMPWLIIAVWLLGGIYALLGTISMIELGTMIPRSGGHYVFARRAFGEYGGFVIGWSDWISLCLAHAALAVAVGEFSAGLLPSLSNHVTSTAILMLLGLALLHWTGLRASARFQEFTSLIKALAFLSLIAASFIIGGKASQSAAGQSAINVSVTFSAIFIGLALSLQSVIFTYGGWDAPVYFGEENRDAARDLPRGMIGGVISVIFIYLLINLALLYVLPLPQLASSKSAAADAAQTIIGRRSGQAISALSLLSAISAMNTNLLQVTRVLFALGRDKLFSNKAAMVNARGTPATAMFLSTLAGMLFVASGTFEILLAITAFFYVVNYAASFTAVLVLRKREPETPRPFKAWGYPWTTLIVLVGSILFLAAAFISDTKNSLKALALIALTYPIFQILRKKRAAVTLE